MKKLTLRLNIFLFFSFPFFLHTAASLLKPAPNNSSNIEDKNLDFQKYKDGLTYLQYTIVEKLPEKTRALVKTNVNVHEFSGNYKEDDPVSLKKFTLPIPRYALGWTALHFAAKEKNSSSMALLLDAGAKVDTQTKNEGLTPLHIVTYSKNALCIQLLLSRNADPFALNLAGLSPLLCAAQRGNFETFKLLTTQAEHDDKFRKKLLKSKTKKEESIFDLAEQGEQTEITAYLQHLAKFPSISEV